MVSKWIIDSLPYDITKRIRQHFASSDDENDGKDSFYIQIGGKKIEIRISNHCTTPTSIMYIGKLQQAF